MLSSQWVLLLLSLIPILNGSLLSEQHDPIAIYLQATETFSEGLVDVLRQRGVLSGWRKEMLTQVELLNNLTLEQRLNKNKCRRSEDGSRRLWRMRRSRVFL